MDWELQQYVKALAKKYLKKSFQMTIDPTGYTPAETKKIANYLGEIGHGISPSGWDGKQYTKLTITATGDTEWLASAYHVPTQLKKEVEEAKRAAGH